MVLLPIVERELRVAARRPGTHGFRVAVVALALLSVVLVVVAEQGWWSPADAGESIFYGVAIPLLGFALAAGPFLTADTLSSERREGTLGLLFLTDLRGRDVVLGKLTAAGLGVASSLVATLPLLTLPLLVGGVSVARVALTALALLLALAVSLSAGMVCSSFTRNGRLALLGTLMLLGLTGGLPFLAYAVEEELHSGGGKVSDWLLLISPVSPTLDAMGEGSLLRAHRGGFLVSCAWQAAMVLAAVALASRRVSRLASVDGEPRVVPHARPAGRDWTRGMHPFWLASGDRSSRRLLLGAALFLAGICFLLLGIAVWGRKDIVFAVSLPAAYFLHLVVKCQFAAEATERFWNDRATGGMELLATSPLPQRVWLEDCWRGLRVRFAASRLLVFLVNGAFVAALASGRLYFLSHQPLFWWLIALFVSGGAFLWLDCRAMMWAGLRASLRSRTAARALLAVVGRVLAPAWILIFLWLMNTVNNSHGGDRYLHVSFGGWIVAGLGWSVWLARRDRRWLEQNLRPALAGELAPAPQRVRRFLKNLLPKAREP